jgi:ABC-2 type transport system ATP-binding protein
MDHGKIVAEGTSRELKEQIAGDSLTFKFKDGEKTGQAALALLDKQPCVREASLKSDGLHLYVKDGAGHLPELVRLLDKDTIPVSSISMSEPTLDVVFLRKTGRSLRDNGSKTNGEK